MTQFIPGFDPEVEPIFFPETCESAGLPVSCPKAASNHHLYIPFNDLDLLHLPTEWRHQDTLQHIRDIGQRVVQLRVRKLSPDRPVNDPRFRKYGLKGTGFVTYDNEQGSPVVNTNRHVVYDQYEASNTEVTFFYEGDSNGIQCAGSSQGFRCPVGIMDRSSFTLQQPLPEAVVTWQNDPASSCESDNQGRTQETAAAKKAEKLDEMFSCSDIADLTDSVIVISHPHGSRKQVSVGKLTGDQRAWTFSHTAPTCEGSSGAPVLTLGRRDDRRPLLARLDYGLDLPDVAAGRIMHQGAYFPDQATILGVGPPRGGLAMPLDELHEEGRRLMTTLTEMLYRHQQGMTYEESPLTRQLLSFLVTFGLFCVVGPPWTLAAFGFFLLSSVSLVSMQGAGGSRMAVRVALLLSVRLTAMHGVTELADFLAPPPDDRGWLWKALLALSHFLVFLIINLPVRRLVSLAMSKQPRDMIQVVERLGRRAEKLFQKLWSFWRLCKTGRGEEVPLAQRILTCCSFLCNYGLFCVVGPPWTLSAFFLCFAIIVSELAFYGTSGLRGVVYYVLSVIVYLAAMHGVTELAYVLAPPDDRGWLWTALLALSYLPIYHVVHPLAF